TVGSHELRPCGLHQLRNRVASICRADDVRALTVSIELALSGMPFMTLTTICRGTASSGCGRSASEESLAATSIGSGAIESVWRTICRIVSMVEHSTILLGGFSPC